MTNFYNSVDLKGVEQPFSLTQKLDSWGDRLMQPHRASYGGKQWTLNLQTKTLEGSALGEPTKLSFLDKVKVKIGLIFKSIAAFFNSEIRAKYELVSGDHWKQAENSQVLKDTPEVRKLLAILYPREASRLSKQGGDMDCVFTLFKCCECCTVLCCKALGAP